MDEIRSEPDVPNHRSLDEECSIEFYDLFSKIQEAFERKDSEEFEYYLDEFVSTNRNGHQEELSEIASMLFTYIGETNSAFAIECLQVALLNSDDFAKVLYSNYNILDFIQTLEDPVDVVEFLKAYASFNVEHKLTLLLQLERIFEIYIKKLPLLTMYHLLPPLLLCLISPTFDDKVNETILSNIEILPPEQQIQVAARCSELGIKCKLYFEVNNDIEINIQTIKALGASTIFLQKVISYFFSPDEEMKEICYWYLMIISYRGKSEDVLKIISNLDMIHHSIHYDELTYTMKRYIMTFSAILLIRANILFVDLQEMIDFASDSGNSFLSLLILRAIYLGRIENDPEIIDINCLRDNCDDSKEEPRAEYYFSKILNE
ncbi:hypothetical protein TVAG_570530 [Trichomonas vaginalis G3]|uniref:Uncharacterized protein n=1 Tax=Trichomonas vaginalis (strain ATCC PRA-98 / G3) TaxID=412133 RepID=A2GDY8_TRIV3|nr:hypothetical protein TVAGG3_0419130 [Trichomonas vaginalis G3]EAX84629.1 hypothetical protein TVAG_570530 [Trichomonas vaginalis G3]KAI5535915.1 hypothetical protein TVAGG3_0419130 [Trichomonas vaginalis G3]|eukprot:XP_001297559.1 hypothetical protein [Trichomonas vaginalis G3]